MSNVSVVHVYHSSHDNINRYVASIVFKEKFEDNIILEKSFKLTNNISTPWIDNDEVNPSVSVMAEKGCRSTMLGDIMNIIDENKNSKWYKVDIFEFTEIEG